MFSKNTNGGSLFSNANTSTPTSTPTPANSTLQKPLKGDSIFGTAAPGATVSTPSPSGSLFGSNANGTQNAQPGNNNLFGAQSNGGMLNNKNGASQTPGFSFGQNPSVSGAGGLLGRSNSAGQSSATGSLGSGASNFSKGPSLFGSTTVGQNPGGLFSGGNSSNTTGLFGAQQPSSQARGPNLFGQGSSSSTLFSNNATQTNHDPYGINITNMPISVSKMPDSLTAPSKEARPHLDESTGSTGSLVSSLNSGNRRTYSMSSSAPNNLALASSMPATSQTSLMNKLSSRITASSNASSSQGIFSPSQNRQWAFQDQGTSSGKGGADVASSSSGYGKLLPSEKYTPFSLQKGDISGLRKLKIDPNRSTAKKLKLLSGNAMETKSNEEEQNEKAQKSVDRKTITNRDSDGSEFPKFQNNTKSDELNDLENALIRTDEKEAPETDASGYWCSPPPEQLLGFTPKELAAVPNFLIGRRGFGCITFDLDVDLTRFAEDLRGQLFGNVVVFNANKTVEVYPDESGKPSIGCGLNVPATITLENVYPVDKKTKKQLRERNNFDEVQVLVRRLKAMRSMDFVSYNPFGGLWTFKVKHFSIWGLSHEEDVEIDEEELEAVRNRSTIRKTLTIPKQGRQLAQSKADSQNYIPGEFKFTKDDNTSLDNTQNGLLDLQRANQAQYNTMLDEADEGDSLIDEKPYEPDVKESDFDGMEVEPPFSTSNDWVEQLKLAGSNLRSVFAETTDSTRTDDNAIELLFADFNENMMMEKKIRKERRLANYNFARFSSSCSLLIKASDKKDGVKNLILPTTASSKLGVMDLLFTKHLKLSTMAERQVTNYPRVTENSLQFKDVAELCKNSNTEYTLWKLCSVLFDLIVLPHDVSDIIAKETLLKTERHQLLCSWIIEQIKDEIDGKIKATSNVLDLIFLHLMKNDIPNASKLAIKSQNGHLAILIASIDSNDPRIRALASDQLERWGTCGCKVNPSISRIYQLLTGNGISGTDLAKSGLGEMSWLALLGANLYYGKIDEFPLEGLIKVAIESVKPDEDDNKYVIFSLYSAKNSTDVLEKIKKTTSLLDHRFLWYFAQIMKFNKQGNLSNYACDKLTCDFIGELRIAQLFREALFAACFITDDFAAKQQIDSLIYHEISFFSSGPNETILQELRIPSSLVFKAAALRDRYENNRPSEVQNLLKAEAFEEAEKVLLTYVGPNLIINGTEKGHKDLTLLGKLLSKFPSSEMQSWSQGLGVYENYLKLKLDSKADDKLINSLIDGLKVLYEANKRHTEILVCCNIISQEVTTAFLRIHQNLSGSNKEKLLGLPMGQPEKTHLKGSWT